jgi:hypothetical protein
MFARVIDRAREAGAITLTPAWTAGRPAEAELRALAYAAAGALGVVVPHGARASLGQDPLPEETTRHLAALLADERVTVRGHNVKPLIAWAFRKG